MLNIVLIEPEIPPNTGNIIRLCANTGFALHLVKPLGFELDDKRLKRAGLDYREWQQIRVHSDWEHCRGALGDGRRYAFTTRGRRHHTAPRYRAGDCLIFGPETRGLSDTLLGQLSPEQWLRIPMQPGSRSMNLANTVAVASYEAWRQLAFAGAAAP
ncbi:MAG: tRNA (uridine(34)/cytosine(34)/5-carboxymethylaminomethyluridine(34)-2'-O)-methyltransferase TrmL [Porticoccaceae bacterium]|jgi:tRNA (cytidine/uridine-2'-O-)-methyltransferase|nr:tRNA (uridine(34)/cytosine(34)/5-carboxymethylaminomethyluridine(34)-2'-O)-methyltransferase TrmL [Porticoccaceae bacterium]